VRNSAILLLFALLLAAGVAIGDLLWRMDTIEVEIAPGARTFRAGDARPRPMPGTFTVDRNARLLVANRDSADHLIGVALVSAGTTVEIPTEYCSITATGPRLVLIVR
jgi:hypothetical protein